MNFIILIKEYQTLVGSLLGSFIAVISSIGLLFLKLNIDKKLEIKNSKKEIEKIFLAALRECEDSISNARYYIDGLKKIIKEAKGEKINVILPPKFNRVIISEDRLSNLSKNLHHTISQQIDIASSAAKKFNGWMDGYEEMPVFIFDGNMKMLQSGLKTKKEIINKYNNDLERYIKTVTDNINNHSKVILLHLLRPVSAIKMNEHDLEKLLFTEKLDDYLDKISESFLIINKDKL